MKAVPTNGEAASAVSRRPTDRMAFSRIARPRSRTLDQWVSAASTSKFPPLISNAGRSERRMIVSNERLSSSLGGSAWMIAIAQNSGGSAVNHEGHLDHDGANVCPKLPVLLLQVRNDARHRRSDVDPCGFFALVG